MKTFNLQLTHDQVDEITLISLKESYRMNAIPDNIDCSDEELWVDHEFLKSIEHVMEYYMTADQKKQWQDEKDLLVLEDKKNERR